MLVSVFSSLLVLAALAVAETPDGFIPSVPAHLDVIFGSKAVSPAGASFSKAGKCAPSESPGPDPGREIKTGLTLPMFQRHCQAAHHRDPERQLDGDLSPVMIDLDVPGGSGGARRTLLHAMIQDFKPSGQTTNGVHTLTSSATGPASYMGPAPPAETPAHPHHYVEVLFEQPASFAVPAAQKSAVSSRMGFNLASFVTAASLGEPIAANYFTVTG